MRVEQGNVLQGGREGIRAATGKQRQAGSEFTGEVEKTQLLVTAQGRGFAGGGKRHEEVHSGFDLAAYAGLVCGIVNFTPAERSQQGGAATFKMESCHNIRSLNS